MKIRITAVILSVLLAACATGTPVELTNARTAYARASSGPAAQLTPADLHKAKGALDEAEQTFQNGDDLQKTIDLAYIAERMAQIAEARAQSLIAQKKTAKARQDFSTKQGELIKTSQGALVENRKELAEAELGQATSERKAAASDLRAAASEQKAADATDALARFAAKEDERGTVITLSGSVLFQSNDAELLPASLTRLDQVADALVSQGRSVVVEGYTDSKGSASSNMTLSRLRAESVRRYLVSRGLPRERIESRGMGADRPVAANSTTEGRANNRRVEIVLAKTP
jgi:outer membrane protein OmpA-like peptidoglycan-associated protein